VIVMVRPGTHEPSLSSGSSCPFTPSISSTTFKFQWLKSEMCPKHLQGRFCVLLFWIPGLTNVVPHVFAPGLVHRSGLVVPPASRVAESCTLPFRSARGAEAETPLG
jgi:hypothetical protein